MNPLLLESVIYTKYTDPELHNDKNISLICINNCLHLSSGSLF